jgi:hypothetical protein
VTYGTITGHRSGIHLASFRPRAKIARTATRHRERDHYPSIGLSLVIVSPEGEGRADCDQALQGLSPVTNGTITSHRSGIHLPSFRLRAKIARTAARHREDDHYVTSDRSINAPYHCDQQVAGTRATTSSTPRCDRYRPAE